MKNIFKSKSKITIILISISTTIFGLALPIITHASIWGDIGKDILSTIGDAIQYLFSWLLKAGASFFEGMLGIGFKNSIGIITTGWTVCRDVANMFFILFMVITAFATIFRIEEYGIKKLLPKVIVIALLINFSMVFCSAIVDFSNIFADFFIKDITENLSQTNESKGIISATFADAFNVTGTYVTFTNCEDFKKLGDAECSRFSSFWDPTSLAICKQAFQNKFEECKTTGRTTTLIDEKSDASFLNLFLEYTVGSIVLLMAAFVLFAGGIMILFRIIVICFLMIISPLVFMCYILPSLRTNWSKWWKTFLNWCIFAPAYAFFVWIAIQIAVSGANKRMGLEANQYTISGNYNPMANSFISAPGQQLISYLVILGFLIGGLIVAKQLGIYGADAVIKIAKGAQKGATNWAKRKFVTRPGQLAGGAAQRFGGATLKKIPGLKTYGAKMEAKGKLLQQKMLKDKDIERDKQLFEQMSPSDLSHAMKDPLMNLTPAQKLALAQVVASDKFKNKIDADATTYAAETLQNFGFSKEANDLRDARLDGLDDIAAEKRVNKLKTSGELGNISAKALELPRIVKLLTRICNAEELEVIRSKSKKQENALKISLTSLATDSSNITNKEIQYAYAAQTGDTSKLGGLSSTEREEFTGKYANSSQLRRIKIDATSPLSETSQAEIMSGIPKNGLRTMIEGMDKGSASYIIRFIKVYRSASPKLKELFNVINEDRYLNSLG
ncbi:MAG TPA: hypothetical protein PLF70_01115 [Candidatus Portnoybacteria bacterium]|nr:hypothetical protein [Candidatus Portnoybacteria bacterium]